VRVGIRVAQLEVLWSLEECLIDCDDNLLVCWISTMGAPAIARELGIDRTSVYRVLGKHLVPVRQSVPNSPTIQLRYI
jgi:hypothetical protein